MCRPLRPPAGRRWICTESAPYWVISERARSSRAARSGRTTVRRAVPSWSCRVAVPSGRVAMRSSRGVLSVSLTTANEAASRASAVRNIEWRGPPGGSGRGGTGLDEEDRHLHPPAPVLLDPDGSPLPLDVPEGPALGAGGGSAYAPATAELPAGSLIALYTNGLTAACGGDTGSRLHLERVLAPAERPLQELCDTAVHRMKPPRDDDAVLLLARTRALTHHQVSEWTLPADPSVVATARRLVDQQLTAWGLGEATFTTGLVISELVTNAIRYGEGPIRLRLIHDGDRLRRLDPCGRRGIRGRGASTRPAAIGTAQAEPLRRGPSPSPSRIPPRSDPRSASSRPACPARPRARCRPARRPSSRTNGTPAPAPSPR